MISPEQRTAPKNSESASLKAPPPASAELSVAAETAGRTIDIDTAQIQTIDEALGAGLIGVCIARHRPYRSIEDLLAQPVVRKVVFNKIRGQITVDR